VPPYRLQTLLQLRERAKEAAEQAFAESLQALKKEKDELVRLEEDLERRKQERTEKVNAYLREVMAKGVGAGGLKNMNRFEERLKDEEAQVALEIERQLDAVKMAEKKVETRRFELAEAAKDLKALEKHKENWNKQVKHERDMREELAGEEIGNALFLARTRKNE
jgi:flagellar export protein FliJ